jgi:hypothetical protein
MSPEDVKLASRRKFLQFLAASPLLAASDLAAFAASGRGSCPTRCSGRRVLDK